MSRPAVRSPDWGSSAPVVAFRVRPRIFARWISPAPWLCTGDTMIAPSDLSRFACCTGVVAIVAIAALASCRPEAHGFWIPGASYDVQLKATYRVKRIPELPRAATDSLRNRMIIDSVRSDSVFGRYLGRLDSLGLPVREGGVIWERIGGQIGRDSFTLVVPFLALDAEVTLRGKIRLGIAAGSWIGPVSLPDSGLFEIRRSSQ